MPTTKQQEQLAYFRSEGLADYIEITASVSAVDPLHGVRPDLEVPYAPELEDLVGPLRPDEDSDSAVLDQVEAHLCTAVLS